MNFFRMNSTIMSNNTVGGTNVSRTLHEVEIILLQWFFNFVPIWEDDEYKRILRYFITSGLFIMRHLSGTMPKWMFADGFCAFSTFNTTTQLQLEIPEKNAAVIFRQVLAYNDSASVLVWCLPSTPVQWSDEV